MTTTQMTSNERRAVISLSTVMSLRMLGLFIVLPIFSLYASTLKGATPPLIGIAAGIYGLTQAIFQIPFGALSDRFGRKKMIALGLCIFALGSIIAALSHTILAMIIGRALQGCGAVGSVIMAMIADLTTEKQRTKAMAMAGMTIGFSFSLAIMLGPLLASGVGTKNLFWLAVLLSGIAIILLFRWVPKPTHLSWHAETEPNVHHFKELLIHPVLWRLNSGIFLLHAIFTASFVVIPISLQKFAGLAGSRQWMLYLPILIGAFCLILPCIIVAEKKQRVKEFFLSGIGLLAVAEFLFWIFAKHLLPFAISLLLFFTAFSLLEAFLPSLISRSAPPARKGTALGMYSCSQFLGIFVGGTVGGWLYGTLGLIHVYLFSGILAIFWLALAFNMKKLQYAHKR